MPFSAGPNIAARPNLVFEYDTGDVKNSYIGEPTTNLYPYSEQVNQWSNNSCTVTANATVAPDGTTTADFLKADGTANYHTVYQIISTTSGLTYTFSCYVQPAGGFNGNTNTFFMQTNDGSWKNITFNLTNLTYSTNAGSGFVQQLQGGWYRVGWTVTIATGGSLYWYIYPTSSPSAETLGGGYYIWGAQLEQKDHATQYLQTPSNTSATRSNTQGLLDVSGQNTTIDLSNMSYTSTADLLFNGSTTEMHPTTVWSYLYSSAMECIFRTTTVSGRKMIFGYRHNDGYSQPTIGSIYLDGNTLNASVITTSQVYRTVTAAATIATNTFYHVVLNKDTSTGNLQLYVNGVLSGTQTFDTATYAQWSSVGQFIGSNLLDIGKSTNTNVGQGWSTSALSGSIPVTRIYSLTLSAQEVLRNYNQLKGRFNLI
jgi:hypothetical protein